MKEFTFIGICGFPSLRENHSSGPRTAFPKKLEVSAGTGSSPGFGVHERGKEMAVNIHRALLHGGMIH